MGSGLPMSPRSMNSQDTFLVLEPAMAMICLLLQKAHLLGVLRVFFFFFFGGQDLVLTRQTLYHLSHTSSP
jgi:hypothetical protein